ncbi:MAG TPA: DUF4331 domain-containing protein [Candidatus Baltobacteraceae bacterium]|nr:DUF4331 domain-containing protein [Candidatus Baltobacteraceae bacterium]
MTKKAVAIAFAAATLWTGNALASSHREAPMIGGAPRLDGTDFYMFNSYETGRAGFVTIVADYQPFQQPFGGPNYYPLETNGIYEIEIDNVGDAQEHITFQFQFFLTNLNISLPIGPAGDQETNAIPLINAGQVTTPNSPNLNVVQMYTVKMITGPRRTGPAVYLTNAADGTILFMKPADNIGNKSIPNYLAYASNFMYNVILPGTATPGRLFVGQRKDPFVVNLGETFDLINYSNPLGPVNGEQDSLINQNVTSLILEVPSSILTNTSTVIGGWTTSSLFEGTNIVQMSRLGMPLVNEVVIGLKDKDKWNGSSPTNDAQFAQYVTNPTLPALLQLLFGADGVVAPTNFPRTDLVEVFLTGVPGLNETGPALAEELRLNTATPPVPAASQNDLGVIGGDVAGYPNGRRPGDDVVDISLRVIMGKLLSTNDAPSGQLPFTDGAYVDASYFPQVWPYINPPLAGSPQSLSVTLTLQGATNVSGPYANTRAQFNGANSTLTTTPTGASTGFYRAASATPGIILGQPAVTSSNVVMKVTVP